MLAALNEIARRWAAAGEGRRVPEQSPAGDSKGNGVIERAVKSVEAQIRVARACWRGGGIRARLEPDNPLLPRLFK